MSRQADVALPGTSGSIAGYRLERYLGRGGAGAVYLARDGRLGRRIALRVVAPELAGDVAFRARSLREARAATAIGHANIIPVYAAGEANGVVYLAMRYVEGGDARSLVSRLGPLDLAQAWTIVAQVASALDAAHGQGLIHRDVKPASMLLDASVASGGAAGHVYLSDFGMSRNPPPGQRAATDQFAGTLDYLAPEQIEGRALDGRADLYSLACAGFELLCGSPPFAQDQGATVMYAQLYVPPPAAAERRPDLPEAVDLVLARALAKSPADRYATCGQFAEELRTALGLHPGEPDSPARLRSQGQGGPAAADGAASGEQAPPRPRKSAPESARAAAPESARESAPESARESAPESARESAPEPARAAAPKPSRAGQPRPAPGPSTPGPSTPGPPAAGPDRASADSASGPDGPGPQQPRRRPGVIRLSLAAAATAIVAATVTLGVTHSDKPVRAASAVSSPTASAPATSPAAASSAPSPPPAATLAPQQAAAVDELLGSSAAARTALQGAVGQVLSCTDLPGAVTAIRTVVDQRTGEYDQALALPTAALASGAIVKSDLITALRDSLDADRDYLTWALQQLSSGCSPGAQTSSYIAAYQADQQANASKEAFVQAWNPVAAQYGVQQKSPASI